MAKVVLFKIGDGDFKTGFRVHLRIWEMGKPATAIEADGGLGSAGNIPRLYDDWKMLYINRQSDFRKGNLSKETGNYRKLSKTKERTTNFSIKGSAEELVRCLNDWLSGREEDFRPIREALFRHLNETDGIRFVISARSSLLWQLPWHLCDLFASYPYGEVTLGSLDLPLNSLALSRQNRIKILVLLGGSEGIDVEADLQLLRDRLPKEAKLAEPLIATDLKTLTEVLWQNDIDILFFAGHSTSQGREGRFFLNETDSVTIVDLKYALRQAIARGLKLAIFNSCDGVQLARDLADLQMPAVIVMREPVPDEAAQAFLAHFLEAFAKKKKPLYRAVKEARERLQGLEKKHFGVTWLPALYQHPYAEDLTWDGMLLSSKALEITGTLPTFPIPRFAYFATTIAASFLVLVVASISQKPLFNYINNKRSESFNKRGAVCFNQKKIECARRNFDLALELNPNNAKALSNMGLLYDSWQEYALARDYFRRAKIYGDPGACNNEARLEIIEGKYNKAESLLQWCLLQDDDPIAQYFILKNLGWVLFEKEQYDEAKTYLQEAIAIKREKGSANCILAMNLEIENNFSEALTEWQYCLNARDEVNEEREWKRIARERIQKLKEHKQ